MRFGEQGGRSTIDSYPDEAAVEIEQISYN